MNSAPIGIFDSGVGGLTVARAILDQLPGESITYIGDTAHTPYGPRPIAQVRELSLNVLDRLVESGVKMIVIACNSASKSEIVLPAFKEGKVALVLDVDSDELNDFDEVDQKYLEQLMRLVEGKL